MQEVKHVSLMQEQVDQEVVDKVIQVPHQQVQKLEQQEILLLQLPHKEMLAEMEFNLVVLDAHKLLEEVVEQEHVELMRCNQVLLLVQAVLVVLDLQLILQVHVSLMVAVVVVDKD